MFRTSRTTAKFAIWRDACLVALIDAADLDSARRYALRVYGPKAAVAWTE